MREILFRGKRIDGSGWVCGDLIRTHPCECHIVNADLDDYNNIIFCFEDYVDYKTVGQSTGLLDKNGKKIFEGDIVRRYHSNRHYDLMMITWYEECAHFVLATSDDFYYCESLMNAHRYCEVVGNIYDNPEFLE